MRHSTIVAAVLVGLVASFTVPGTSSAQTTRDADLRSSVDDGFSIAVVGDVIIAHSLQHMMSNPRFAAVVEILRGADVATGNLETQIIDGRSFVGTRGGSTHGAEPESAEWLLEMGFDVVARPNNHANDYGYEGLLETSRHLDRAGLQHSGLGDTYWAARSARFVTTSRGRVGMVATSENAQAAVPGNGEWAGRGGLSPFNVTMYLMVPADSWDAVRTLRNLFPNGTGFYARGANTADHIAAVGQQFRKAPAGVTEPYYSFDINQRDLQDVIAAVREGKQRSDFITLALHSHDFRDTRGGYRGFGIPEAEHLDTNPSIADYLPVLAKAAIDNGADLFQGTGVHVLRGIEIYDNRPIFYGLGEFIRQRDVGGLAGRGDLSRDSCAGCPFPAKYESVVAVSRFSGDRLVEVQLHPVELRYESERLAHRGIPETAPPDVGRRILERLQELSAPLGTTITIEGNVGVIRP
ncbi:MAG TPA: CapA family protein [Longimicrobiales bacterium]|nr:CapA family protein [Longimicrobiales bacterium]